MRENIPFTCPTWRDARNELDISTWRGVRRGAQQESGLQTSRSISSHWSVVCKSIPRTCPSNRSTELFLVFRCQSGCHSRETGRHRAGVCTRTLKRYMTLKPPPRVHVCARTYPRGADVDARNCTYVDATGKVSGVKMRRGRGVTLHMTRAGDACYGRCAGCSGTFAT